MHLKHRKEEQGDPQPPRERESARERRTRRGRDTQTRAVKSLK